VSVLHIDDSGYADACALVLEAKAPTIGLLTRELGLTPYQAEGVLKRMVAERRIDGPFFEKPIYRMRT
jgi:hypothetical protein